MPCGKSRSLSAQGQAASMAPAVQCRGAHRRQKAAVPAACPYHCTVRRRLPGIHLAESMEVKNPQSPAHSRQRLGDPQTLATTPTTQLLQKVRQSRHLVGCNVFAPYRTGMVGGAEKTHSRTTRNRTTEGQTLTFRYFARLRPWILCFHLQTSGRRGDRRSPLVCTWSLACMHSGGTCSSCCHSASLRLVAQ